MNVDGKRNAVIGGLIAGVLAAVIGLLILKSKR